MAHAELFSPLRIKGLVLPNRVVAPPMYQVRPLLSPGGIAWHRRLAAGGAGMVIVQGTSVRSLATKMAPGDLRPLAEAIRGEGAAAAIQLFPVVEPGPGAAEGPDAPDAVTIGQIETLIEQFARAADICRRGGFQAVQPHGAHGFLLNQFFMPDRNTRRDEYGGSLENRCRLAVRIVQAIRRSTGPDFIILYRHTPVGDAYGLDDSLVLAGKLIEAGVDVLDISPARDAAVADLAAPFKARFGVPVIAVGGMEDPAAAAEAIRLGRCDLVAIGRALIADAHWPRKVRAGRIDQLVACTKCDEGCFGSIEAGKPAVCVQWEDGELDAYVPRQPPARDRGAEQ